MNRRVSAIVTMMLYAAVFVVPAATPLRVRAGDSGDGGLAPEVVRALGIPRPAGVSATEASLAAGDLVEALVTSGSAFVPNSVGVASIMAPNAPFSAAVMTTVGSPFFRASLLGDWDGREDLVADHEGKVLDLSSPLPPPPVSPQFVFTRAAVSEHTRANGFNENVYYVGDSLGNVYVVASNTLGPAVPTPQILRLNLPTILNAFGTLNSDDQIVVTGLCVSPVVDLTSFPNVNGSFAPFTNQIGEILYVTFMDTGSGLRLTATGTPFRSGLLAFPVADPVSPAAAPPGVQSPAGFPVTVGGSFGVAYSVFSNVAGCAVDDDGSVYFQQVDLIGFTGANIVKVARTGTNQDRSGATNGILNITSLTPLGGNYGTASGPAPAQVNTFTNYSGTSTTFGNIVALAAGPGNALYAAVARSLNAADPPTTQATEGRFVNPAALGPTPSMVISFVDAIGATGPTGLPVGDGFADVAIPFAGLVPGVNNFRVFVHGTGPDVRNGTGVLGSPFDTLQVAMQVDYSIYAGLTVDEERKVYVVSGGA